MDFEIGTSEMSPGCRAPNDLLVLQKFQIISGS
eukprot:SAG31_NODE_9148_length_1326_cov_1.079055_1_plen_32_part_10